MIRNSHNCNFINTEKPILVGKNQNIFNRYGVNNLKIRISQLC